MFTRFTHLANPKKIIGLKSFQELRKTGYVNDIIIKCLNFSENSGWVYIISTFGRKQYNKFCVS